MRRPLRLALVALVVTGLVGAVGGMRTDTTLASWTDGVNDTATLSTGVMNPVTTFNCQSGSGFLDSTVGFTWSQPSTTGNGLTPTSYEMRWTGIVNGTAGPFAGLSGDVPVGLLSIGTYTVQVRAIKGTWTSAWSTQTRRVTVLTLLLWNCS